MKFADIVAVSERLRSTAKKKEKVGILAELFGRSHGRETYLLAHYLVGSTPQGKLGIRLENHPGIHPAPDPLCGIPGGPGGPAVSREFFKHQRLRVVPAEDLNPQRAPWQAVGKRQTLPCGLTDQMLRWMMDRLLGLEIDRDEYTVYVKPELVVEIAYSDIQESPRYPGGLALRFARVKRFREEKPSQEADTIQTVWSLFETTVGGKEAAPEEFAATV